MKNNLLAFLAFAFLLVSCSSEEKGYAPIEEVSPVVMDLNAVPYPKLSDYHFFEGEIKDQNPSYGVVPFKPTSELFSDYARKKRFVWLPNNTVGTYNGDGNILEFPVGAALVKSFYYDHALPGNTTKIIETRVMIHQTTGWIFAKYVWNEAQTDAFLQAEGGTVPISWIDANSVTQTINYEMPSETHCTMCHTTGADILPIGIKPQNLNSNYNYPEGQKNQLTKLVEFGYLQNVPTTITSVVDYNDTSKSLDLRVRSYFDINCAHCHSDGGNADYVALRFPFASTALLENMGVCVGTTTQVPGISHGYFVKPNDTSQSVLHYMMNTSNSIYRMPRLGRTIVHNEGVALVAQWINALPECQ